MKFFHRFLLTSFLLTGIGASIFSQNSPPTVEIQHVHLDPVVASLTIMYDLDDSEGDTCTVRVLISEDQGVTFSAFPFSQVGDVGEGILPGSERGVQLYPIIVPDSLIRVKIIAYDAAEEDLSEWVAQVDTNRIKADLVFIAQERNHLTSSNQIDGIRDSLGNRMLEAGLQTVFQPVPYGTYTGANVNGTLPGLETDTSLVIVDAHFDGVPGTPGANDNGIAVAALLEISRILSAGHYRRSLEFIAFDLEEYGLVGSEEYIQEFNQAEQSILGVLNLEMIGYFTEEPNTQEFPAGFQQLFPALYSTVEADSFRGNFLANVANIPSIPLQTTFDSLSMVYAPELIVYSLALSNNGFFVPDFRRSDHANFWDASIPALMLVGGGDLRDSAYHTGSDSLSRISIGKVEMVVKATLATAAHLAEPLHAGEDMSAVLTVSGVGEVLERSKISLFPNPASDKFQLHSESPIRSVTIFDLNGRELLRQYPNAPNVEIVCSEFPTGMYVLIAETNEGLWNSSWMKE